MELLFALSYDDLKIKLIPSEAVNFFKYSAVLNNISFDSIAHGPAIIVSLSAPISKSLSLIFLTLIFCCFLFD